MNMHKSLRGKIALSGFTALGIGIALLIFTFVSAYLFLSTASQMISTQNLTQNFGEAMAWLITTSIRVMYLGVMGWIGSLITIRGVNLTANAQKTEPDSTQGPQEPQQAKAKLEEETKAAAEEEAEPEIAKQEEAEPEEAKPQEAEPEEAESPEAKPQETKPEVPPTEPEMIAIPLEEMEQQQQLQDS
jgi:cytoskeletal protein RodZ